MIALKQIIVITCINNIRMNSSESNPSSDHSIETVEEPRFYFEYAYKMIPHPNKANKGGEDACYTHDNLLAVADGVSGWAEFGIDASLYSRRLIDLIAELFQGNNEYYIQNPQALVSRAVELNTQLGSSTICVLTLNPQTGVLNSVHLGDSIYGIYRGQSKRLLYQVQEQQKQFNLPYQVGVECDSPLLSINHQFQTKSNDVVILGSDGLWDNVYPQAIQSVIKQNDESIVDIVETLTDGAYTNSLDSNFPSPFYQKARLVGVPYPPMGKDDDITVIGAKIVKCF